MTTSENVAERALESASNGPPIIPPNELSQRRVLDVYKLMLVSLFIALLVVFGILFVLIGRNEPPILPFVQFAGAMGALFSNLVRLYNLEDLPKALNARELEGLSWVYLLIYSLVPVVLGYISATAIHLLFASGLLGGQLFPHFVCKMDKPAECLDFVSLIKSFGPETAQDYAKVIVWGFVAGFAERLVPDTLRGLSKSAQQGSESGGNAPPTRMRKQPQ